MKYFIESILILFLAIYILYIFVNSPQKIENFEECIHIPKIIHQIWIGPKQPPKKCMDSVKEMYSDWEYKLWTEKDIDVDKLRNKEAYINSPQYAGKADVLRYEILYDFGGVYIDADSMALKKIPDEMLNCSLFSAYENEKERGGLIGNGIIGCHKGSPIMETMIEAVKKEPIESIRKKDPWLTTGPKIYTEIINKNMDEKIKIYPSYYFYPTHHTGTKCTRAQKEQALFEHIWGNTHNLYKHKNEINNI